MSNTKEEVNVSKMYGEECMLSKNDFIQKYRVSDKRFI